MKYVDDAEQIAAIDANIANSAIVTSVFIDDEGNGRITFYLQGERKTFDCGLSAALHAKKFIGETPARNLGHSIKER